MTDIPKEWRNFREGGTPVDAAALQDMETRLAAYADTVVGTPGETGPAGAAGAAGAPGPGTVTYISENAAQEDFTTTSYTAAGTPDRVDFTLDAIGIVTVYAQLNGWASNDLDLQIQLDGAGIVNYQGAWPTVEGHLGAGTAGGALLGYDAASFGWRFQYLGSSLDVPIPLMGVGMPLRLAAGAHSVELVYKSSTGAPAHISQRRLIVTGASA